MLIMFAVFTRFNPAYEEAARDQGATGQGEHGKGDDLRSLAQCEEAERGSEQDRHGEAGRHEDSSPAPNACVSESRYGGEALRNVGRHLTERQ